MSMFNPPIYNEDYNNSNEGGMFVMLAVFDKENNSSSYEPAITIDTTEVYVGADKVFPESIEKTDRWGNIGWNTHITFRAAIHMGTTGWTGYHEPKGHYWMCTYDFLNEDGKALYNSVQKAFPNCELYLLTFLDT